MNIIWKIMLPVRNGNKFQGLFVLHVNLFDWNINILSHTAYLKFSFLYLMWKFLAINFSHKTLMETTGQQIHMEGLDFNLFTCWFSGTILHKEFHCHVVSSWIQNYALGIRRHDHWATAWRPRAWLGYGCLCFNWLWLIHVSGRFTKLYQVVNLAVPCKDLP